MFQIKGEEKDVAVHFSSYLFEVSRVPFSTQTGSTYVSKPPPPPILGRETEATGPPEQLLVVTSGIKALL